MNTKKSEVDPWWKWSEYLSDKMIFITDESFRSIETIGFCFVTFPSHELADACKKLLTNSTIRGRQLHVSWAETNNKVCLNWLNQSFEEDNTDLEIKKKKIKTMRYEGKDELMFVLHNIQIEDEEVMSKVTTLYVSNLPVTVDDDILHGLMLQFGDIVKVNLFSPLFFLIVTVFASNLQIRSDFWTLQNTKFKISFFSSVGDNQRSTHWRIAWICFRRVSRTRSLSPRYQTFEWHWVSRSKIKCCFGQTFAVYREKSHYSSRKHLQ